MAESREGLEKTKRLMGALLRMPPKPHSEMKLKQRKNRQVATKLHQETKMRKKKS
jgi:hypothetical protein